MMGCIGRINADESVTIVSIEERTGIEEDIEEVEQRFLVQIEEAIRNGTAVAAIDAAMVENYIATHWIVTTRGNEVEITGNMRLTKWRNGMILAGEGIGLLGLIKYIVNAIKDVEHGEIRIFNDNKKLLKEVEKYIKKESNCTQEAGAVVEGIRREIKRSNVNIKLEYLNNKPQSN